MTRIDSTKVKWRVQVRESRAHKWQNRGLFETREVARYSAWIHRDLCSDEKAAAPPAGFGNTRVVRFQNGRP